LIAINGVLKVIPGRAQEVIGKVLNFLELLKLSWPERKLEETRIVNIILMRSKSEKRNTLLDTGVKALWL
jgi:hypothetical protein